MDRRLALGDEPVIRVLGPAAAAFLLLAVVYGGALGGLFSAGSQGIALDFWNDAYVLSVLRFCTFQAFLSALLSVAAAVPVARALARRSRLPGRNLLLRLLGVPMVLPTIVGILGIVAVYGRSGLLSDWLAPLGLRLDIYGLTGILIAHVFFNLPLAVRLLLHGWRDIPAETWRLAGQLGMDGRRVFRLIEMPMLRDRIPAVFGLVFLLCFTSFTIVLVLGGGPPNATLEVAIYQALRFDFDLSRVAAFAVLQVLFGGLLVLLWTAFGRDFPNVQTLAPAAERFDGRTLSATLADGMALALCLLFLAAPLASVLVAGVSGPVGRVMADAEVWRATLRSILVGGGAALISCGLGWGLVLSARRLRVRRYRATAAGLVELTGSLVLLVPPFVTGAGLFILLRHWTDVFSLALPIVVLVNALMGLPFVVRILAPPATVAAWRHAHLADSLGMAGWNRFRWIDWPILRKPFGMAFALVWTLSLGDMGAIALFGTDATRTLPLFLYQRIGSYRMDEAAVIALLLVFVSLTVFILVERVVGGSSREI